MKMSWQIYTTSLPRMIWLTAPAFSLVGLSYSTFQKYLQYPDPAVVILNLGIEKNSSMVTISESLSKCVQSIAYVMQILTSHSAI